MHIGVPSLKLTAKAPKNGWLEYYFPIGKPCFQVRTVSFREGTSFGKKTHILPKKLTYPLERSSRSFSITLIS